ncbi:hypothetical protein VPH35_074577 [Triticum aestivum]
MVIHTLMSGWITAKQHGVHTTSEVGEYHLSWYYSATRWRRQRTLAVPLLLFPNVPLGYPFASGGQNRLRWYRTMKPMSRPAHLHLDDFSFFAVRIDYSESTPNSRVAYDKQSGRMPSLALLPRCRTELPCSVPM